MSEVRWFPELQTVAAVIAHHGAARADEAALICDGQITTYRELDLQSNCAALALRAAGLVAGDRVAYFGKDSEHYFRLLFGCAKAQTVLVPINWRLTAAEVDHILQDSSSRLLFIGEEFNKVAEGVREELPVIYLESFMQWIAPHDDSAPAPAAGPDDPMVQMYTSGTTGLPKGVVLAQRSFFKVRDALAENGLDWIDWRAGDRNLLAIPGYHIGGLWWSMQGFSAGITNVVMPMFTGKDATELIKRHGITTTCMVPAMLQMMLSDPDAGPDAYATVRKVAYGGSPISETLLGRCIEILDCDFAQLYGLTETGNTAICLPPDQHFPGSPRLRAAGRPYPGFGLKIIDRAGRPLGPGEVGEVCLRTPAQMLEYWGLKEATEQTLVDGWVHTGDAGYTDEDGYLFIHDRIKDTIIVASENVFPAEIENALCKHPAVVEAAVIGVPDPRWGEAVQAFVVLRPEQPVSPFKLNMFLKDHLASFKIPTRYEFIDRVPRNPSGKILRRTLRDRHWAEMDRQVN